VLKVPLLGRVVLEEGPPPKTATELSAVRAKVQDYLYALAIVEDQAPVAREHALRFSAGVLAAKKKKRTLLPVPPGYQLQALEGLVEVVDGELRRELQRVVHRFRNEPPSVDEAVVRRDAAARTVFALSRGFGCKRGQFAGFIRAAFQIKRAECLLDGKPAADLHKGKTKDLIRLDRNRIRARVRQHELLWWENC
jgi:hypothetical protein